MASAPSDQEEMRLNVRYRGPDVDRGRMSALELGPAIFGMGQMVGRTSRVLYGDEIRVKVEVRAEITRLLTCRRRKTHARASLSDRSRTTRRTSSASAY